MGRTSFPKGHGRWPIAARYSQGVRAGPLIFVGGQGDLDGQGRVCHAGDLAAQTGASVRALGAVLEDLGAGLSDLVNLVAFYVPEPGAPEGAMLRHLRRALGEEPMPTVSAIPVPYLSLPGLRVLIEGIAMRSEGGAVLARRSAAPAGHWRWPEGGGFAQGVHSGEMIFVSGQMALDGAGQVIGPDDIVRQSEIVMENMAAVLAELGATLKDAVRFNIFYRGTGTTKDWEVAARVRARYFEEPGPCATGIPVPRFDREGLAIAMWVWAMVAEDGRPIPRQHVWPEGSWDWSFHLPYKHGLKCRNLVFVGGQVPLDAKSQTLAKHDGIAQTHIAMGYLSRVLHALGLGLDDIVKINGYHGDDSGEAGLVRNLAVRQQFFAAPGPVTTETPLPFLAIDDMRVEIEAVAAVPASGRSSVFR